MRLKTSILCFLVLILAVSCNQKQNQTAVEKPNVLIIYTDDVGYGDIGIYGGLIPTPNIDVLAETGLKFSNAYATAATCTPSRYSFLTGEYAWRAKGRGVAPGDAQALIKPGTETLPEVFKKAGYQTGVIGKWHLGLGDEKGPDWNGKISPGPLEIGFDYSFLIPATGDRVPTVFVENHRVVNLDPNDPIKVSYKEKVGDWPTGKDNPELLTTMWSHGHDQTIVNGISRIGYMEGGTAALWRDEDIADQLVDKAKTFLTENQEKPFFLFFSTHDIHVPRIANERFQGKSGFGPRGDVLLQLDWTVGELLKKLEELGIRDNTMILFSSDNGPVLDDGYVDQAKELIGDHKPSRNLRGGKYSAFEAGSRVPLIVNWPAGIKKGETDVLFSQVDFLASFSAYLKIDFNKEQAIDSQNHWEALTGKSKSGRTGLVQEAVQNVLSYVSSDGFKYISPSNGPAMIQWGPEIETGFSKSEQLYDIKNDPSEQVNMADMNQAKLEEMKKALQQIVSKQ